MFVKDYVPVLRNLIAAAIRTAVEEERERIKGQLAAAYYLIDQLDCLAVEKHPALYEQAQRWKANSKPSE